MSQTHEEISWENRQECTDLLLKIKSQLKYDKKNLIECLQVINYFLNPNDNSRKDIMKYGAELSDLQRYEELYNELTFRKVITALRLACLIEEQDDEIS